MLRTPRVSTLGRASAPFTRVGPRRPRGAGPGFVAWVHHPARSGSRGTPGIPPRPAVPADLPRSRHGSRSDDPAVQRRVHGAHPRLRRPGADPRRGRLHHPLGGHPRRPAAGRAAGHSWRRGLGRAGRGARALRPGATAPGGCPAGRHPGSDRLGRGLLGVETGAAARPHPGGRRRRVRLQRCTDRPAGDRRHRVVTRPRTGGRRTGSGARHRAPVGRRGSPSAWRSDGSRCS